MAYGLFKNVAVNNSTLLHRSLEEFNWIEQCNRPHCYLVRAL